jgi:hypothetical protein
LLFAFPLQKKVATASPGSDDDPPFNVGTQLNPNLLHRTLRLCHLLVLGFTSIAIAQSTEKLPPPKHITIPRLHASIHLDGKLDEPVWAKAAVLKPFYLNDGTGPEREHTEVRLWYDDQALYLGWRCEDRDIQATLTNRDSKFWEEEVVEFFITPKELKRYFELQWNPLGGMFDAIIDNDLDEYGVSKDFHGDWSFTAKQMQSAVLLKGTPNNSTDRDVSWQVEVKLPFADLSQTAPRPRDVWRGNFYRFNRTKGLPVEELSWSPTRLHGFHQPTRFGFLEFGE